MARYVEIASGIYRLSGEIAGEGAFSSFLIQEGAIIEPGPTSYWTLIKEGLAQLDYDTKSLSYIIPTHVHLDHGGGAGYLAQLFPRAKVLAHPQGARHLIDPSRLIASTKLAFGEDFETRYGPILPVPEAQVYVPQDGEMLHIGSREMKVVYSPGHAPHHFSLLDLKTGGLFCGEALGNPDAGGTDFVFPSAAPPGFDLKVYLETMEKLRALSPKALFYTHTPTPGREVNKLIDLSVENSRQIGEVILAGLKAGEAQPQIEQKVNQYINATSGRQFTYADVRRQRTISDMTMSGYIFYFKRQGLA